MPRYTDEQKKKFLDLVAGGAKLKDAAKAAGISPATAVKLRMAENRRAAGGAPLSEEGEQEKIDALDENLSEGDVPKPTAGAGGAAAGAGAGGAAAARRALVDGEEVPVEEVDDDGGTKPPPTGEAPKPTPPPVDVGRMLVDLSKMFTLGMVKLYAVRHKVKMDAEMVKACEWTSEEEAALRAYATPAANALGMWFLALGPYLAPLFYGWALYNVVADRFEYVKDRKRKAGGGAAEQPEEKETIVEEEPMPNGFRPQRAETPSSMRELFKASWWNDEKK